MMQFILMSFLFGASFAFGFLVCKTISDKRLKERREKMINNAPTFLLQKELQLRKTNNSVYR